jgi:hypothetical protein
MFIQIAAADDLDSTNNIEGPFAVTLLPPDVNYSATAPTHNGPLVAGGAIDETFTLQNSGDDPGSQKVHWTAYVSTNSSNLPTALDADVVIDSGSHDPLGAHSDSLTIPIKGTWPSAFGSYYLKVQVSAADDNDASDDIKVSDVFNTTHVDYTVDSVSSTGPYLAGNAINGSFKLHNTGDAKGSKPVFWSAYVSTDTNLDGGDTLVASSTTAQLDPSAAVDVPITPITADWPKTIDATYYLIVSVAAADDTGTDPNVKASPGFTTSAPSIDYAVTSVSYSGGLTAQVFGNVIDASFQLKNNSTTRNGSQQVNWTAYAVDSSAIPIDSGVSQPLAASASVSIPIVGKWPKHFGTYDIVVQVSVSGDFDTNSLDDSMAYGTTTDVGRDIEPNSDYAGLSVGNVQDLGIVLEPGLSVSIRGTLGTPSTDTDDVFAYNTGTAASVTVYISWTGNHNVTIFFMTGAGTYAQSANVPLGTSISDTWLRDVVPIRWIRVSSAQAVSYTLTMTGN